MSNFKPIDAKRDDFRKYLERTGALEAISKTFTKLLIIHSSERPENAVEFICENLGYTLHQNDIIESLKQELDDSKNEIAQLKNVIELMKNNKNTELLSSDDQNNDESDDKPSSTTEILSVTEVENQMKNLSVDFDKNDDKVDVIEKSLDEDSSSVPVQEEQVHSKPVTAPEPQEEVTEEVK